MKVSFCNKCDIWKKCLISDNKFKYKFTGRVYNIRGTLSCNNLNAVYSISCKNCGDHYVGSAAGFKARFKIRKSNIKTKKYRFGTARHFKNKFCDRSNSQIFLQVQLIKSAQNDVNLEDKLWGR